MYETAIDKALGKKTMGPALAKFEALMDFELRLKKILDRLANSGVYEQIIRDWTFDVIILVHRDHRREFLTPDCLYALFHAPPRPVLRLVP